MGRSWFLIVFLSLLGLSALFAKSCFSQDTTEISSCLDKIHSKEMDVAFVLEDRFIIGGYIDSVLSPDHKRMRIMSIYDCKNSTDLFVEFFCMKDDSSSFCLPSLCEVFVADSSMCITHYGRLECGKDWILADIPVFQQTIRFTENDINSYSGKSTITIDPISRNEVQEILDLFEEKSQEDFQIVDQVTFDQMTSLILRISFCALSGNEECLELFLNLDQSAPKLIEGLNAEIYYQWRGIYSLKMKMDQ